MEEKIIKVYSNNSKKSRLKRNKNKFQRVWDAEKQMYVKVRKNKASKISAKKNWREVDNSKALKRRQTTPKAPKSVPVITVKKTVKPEIKQPARKEVAKATVTKIHGINYSWDTKELKYKRAA